MSWICYELNFRTKSPIHVGFRKLGIVNQTRYYIPAKNFWGAATSRIAQSLMKHLALDYDPEIYREVGDFLNQNIVFSYFYPMAEDIVYLPRYTDNGLKFGPESNYVSIHEFERIFISSYVSTAIEKRTRSAEEGSLHEIEFIKPKVEDINGKIKNVNFKGYLFARKGGKGEIRGKETFSFPDENDIKLNVEKVELSFTELISNFQVGGERNYGFGWVELVDKIKKTEKIFEGYEFNQKSSNRPEILCGTEMYLFSHVDIIFEEDLVNGVQGDIEPLVSRIWDKEKGAGQWISGAEICYVPGTKIITSKSAKIEILENGIGRLSSE